MTDRHGTVGGYVNDKCRCVTCRHFWLAYCRAYYHARKAAGRCYGCGLPSTERARCARCRDKVNRRERFKRRVLA